MTDLLLRRVSKSRAGADGPDDYDVAGPSPVHLAGLFVWRTDGRSRASREVRLAREWRLDIANLPLSECGGGPHLGSLARLALGLKCGVRRRPMKPPPTGCTCLLSIDRSE
jgi:hypothetical protein